MSGIIAWDESRRFGEILVKCIDDALTVFGESVRQAIYFYLEKDHNLKREQIPLRPDQFDQAISMMLGPEGARTIKLLALKPLYGALGTRGAPSEDFDQEVRKLRMKFALSSTSVRGDYRA